mgnify:CR=1 FL=1|jgi:hypothetical protein|tara:strand:- start:444 stop:1253 length:810 start_codon:yes stop_codon:yes gene_type:complete
MSLSKLTAAISRAVNKCADQIGTASVTSREAQGATETARASFVALMHAWGSTAIRTGAGSADTLEMVCHSFKALKIRAGNAARIEYERLLELYPTGIHSPRGTAEAARKNGSKGVRQRRRAVSDWLELLASDPAVALATVEPTSALSWSEKAEIWAALKRARCAESRLMVHIGTDSAGLIHALGADYADTYVVTTDDDGTERCEITIGPRGRTENLSVLISKARSGEVYQTLADVIAASRNQLQSARRFVTATEDDQTLDAFYIPPIAE